MEGAAGAPCRCSRRASHWAESGALSRARFGGDAEGGRGGGRGRRPLGRVRSTSRDRRASRAQGTRHSSPSPRLRVIACVGETLEQRDARQAVAEVLKPADRPRWPTPWRACRRFVVAYEPRLGESARVCAGRARSRRRRQLELHSVPCSTCPILYGGSVKARTAGAAVAARRGRGAGGRRGLLERRLLRRDRRRRAAPRPPASLGLRCPRRSRPSSFSSSSTAGASPRPARANAVAARATLPSSTPSGRASPHTQIEASGPAVGLAAAARWATPSRPPDDRLPAGSSTRT